MAERSAADGTWTMAAAKACFSELVERAQTDPQFVTRNGKPSAVVVSVEEWERKARRRGSLAEFLLASPLRDLDLDLERRPDGTAFDLELIDPRTS